MEGERVSSGLSIFEINRERKKMTVVAGPGGINTPQSPTIIYGWHNATLAKTERIRRFLAGYENIILGF
jgi:hypothetical protein